MKIDLQRGVVPISAVGKQIARLIIQTTTERNPVLITQKGRPTAALISIELLEQLLATTTTEATDD